MHMAWDSKGALEDGFWDTMVLTWRAKHFGMSIVHAIVGVEENNISLNNGEYSAMYSPHSIVLSYFQLGLNCVQICLAHVTSTVDICKWKSDWWVGLVTTIILTKSGCSYLIWIWLLISNQTFVDLPSSLHLKGKRQVLGKEVRETTHGSWFDTSENSRPWSCIFFFAHSVPEVFFSIPLH